MAHDDLRGDDIFVCDDDRYPDGSLCIGCRLLFCRPVALNLDYLMSTASVLPELYSGDNMQIVLRAFSDQVMAATSAYLG